jgi:CBS domain-containing membrane protein
MELKTTGELMTTDVVTVKQRQHLKRAASEVHLGRIRHLPVVDEYGVLVGLVTQRDILAAGDHLDRPIAEIMQRDVTTVSPETPACEAAYLLLRHDIGCVPVTDTEGKLLGIVTDTDFVRVAYRSLGGMVPVEQLEAEEREADHV